MQSSASSSSFSCSIPRSPLPHRALRVSRSSWTTTILRMSFWTVMANFRASWSTSVAYLGWDSGQTNSHFAPLRPTQEPSEHCMASWVQTICSPDVLGAFPFPHDARKKESATAKIAVLFIWKPSLSSRIRVVFHGGQSGHEKCANHDYKAK